MINTDMLQLSGLNAANIFAYIIFGGVGFAAFLYGKKNQFFRAMILGVALMIYPYFISGTLLLYLIGIILTVAFFLWRD